jgi:hypothetical protein
MMWHDTAAVTTALILTAIGVLHLAWSWTPWPAADFRTLSDHVYGGATMPGKTPCIVVGTGLLAGAYCLLAEADTVPEIAPHTLFRFGIWTLAALLMARGLAGPAFSLRGAAEFRRWNLFAYSPLCLMLGLGALAAATR